MIKKIGSVGKGREQLVYRQFRVERKGFLSIISYAIDGYARRFDMMHRGHAVVVLPADFRTRELYMLSEIRPNKPFAALDRGRAWLRKVFADAFTAKEEAFTVNAQQARIYELPAGMIDMGDDGEPDETPEEAAVRELREETGVVVDTACLIPIPPYFTTIGGSTEVVHAFIAMLPEGHLAARAAADGDGSEEMDILTMSWDDAFGLLADGGIETASTGLLLRELKIIDLEGRK
ncbi:MAG TPA: NUDIX domain-containing protein [Candidatus Baltobacteraceae bacterium]|nr:NUDIX domain-containing protein [Candidatus Baltobacteraceae bacterium]